VRVREVRNGGSEGEMRTQVRTRRWLKSVAAFLCLALAGTTGCQTWYGGMTLPSGRYLDGHFPQYFTADPTFPLPRELNSQEDPEGAIRGGGRAGIAAPGAPVPVRP
jgi:hypothetical protein